MFDVNAIMSAIHTISGTSIILPKDVITIPHGMVFDDGPPWSMTEEELNAQKNKDLIMSYLKDNRAERRAAKFKRKSNTLNEDQNVQEVNVKIDAI